MTTKYEAAAHKVQSAIAANPNKRPLEPKHMRVGIDMSKADHAGLVTLLIAKGVFTLEEYTAAIEKSAEDEAEMHRHAVAKELGVHPSKISFG